VYLSRRHDGHPLPTSHPSEAPCTMKRTRGDNLATGSQEAIDLPRPKRPKSSLACLTCRKAKARCEPGPDKATRRCHRCTSLFLSCSFEEDGSPTTSAYTGADVAPSLPPSAPSSRGYSPPVPLPFDGRTLKAEDLIAWESTDDGRAHWSTVPMAAMDELMHRCWVPPEPLQHTILGDDALVVEQIPYLLSMCVSYVIRHATVCLCSNQLRYPLHSLAQPPLHTLCTCTRRIPVG
jgi:hypothetical protein